MEEKRLFLRGSRRYIKNTIRNAYRRTGITGYLVYILLIAFLTGCEPLSLEGKVVNQEDEGIAEAIVAVKNNIKQTHTDSNGYFKIDSLGVGDTVWISAKGYQTQHSVYDPRFSGRKLKFTLIK